jgi:hypothetical protein
MAGAYQTLSSGFKTISSRKPLVPHTKTNAQLFIPRPLFWDQFQSPAPTFYDSPLVPILVDVSVLRDDNLQSGCNLFHNIEHKSEHSRDRNAIIFRYE